VDPYFQALALITLFGVAALAGAWIARRFDN
jgi:hypothetical protein